MLFTLTIEFLFALYVLISSKLRRSSTIIITLILICLGIFQLAEFQVCGGDKTLYWMRLGYVAITLLPALGIHLISIVTKRRVARYLGYIIAAGFIWVFLFNPASIHTVACGGNYILINTNGVVASTYFPIYYSISLTIAILEILSLSPRYKGREDKDSRNMVYWLLGGYASFLIPTAAVYLISPAARAGIPSIMCGFAILLSIILTFFVYPLCKKLDI